MAQKRIAKVSGEKPVFKTSLKAKKERALEVYSVLRTMYPDAECSLDHADALQLMVATILSAQCTDARVNMVTPALFERYKTAFDYADSSRKELEGFIKTCGFYRQKAKNIQSACARIVAEHGGEVPDTLEELVALDGVGRKTANVILGTCFNTPGVVVDTHCKRVTRRLGFTKEEDPVKIERDLMKIWPHETWSLYSHMMVFHGRALCIARAPRCSECDVRSLCPFPTTREGVKIAR